MQTEQWYYEPRVEGGMSITVTETPIAISRGPDGKVTVERFEGAAEMKRTLRRRGL